MSTPLTTTKSPTAVSNQGMGLPWNNPLDAAGMGTGTAVVAAILSTTITGNVATFVTQVQNVPLVAGQQVVLTLGNPNLNGMTVTVLSAGLSTTSFSANITHADVASVHAYGWATPTTTYALAVNYTYLSPTPPQYVAYVRPNDGPQPVVGFGGIGFGIFPFQLVASLRWMYGQGGYSFGPPSVTLTTENGIIPELPPGISIVGMYPFAKGISSPNAALIQFYASWTDAAGNNPGSHIFTLGNADTLEVSTGSIGTDINIIPTVNFTQHSLSTLNSFWGENYYYDNIDDFGIAIVYEYLDGTPAPNQLQQLAASTFNFNLPVSSSVSRAHVSFSSGVSEGSSSAVTLTVQLTLDDEPIGDVKTISVGNWTSSYSLGGSSDLTFWGLTPGFLSDVLVNQMGTSPHITYKGLGVRISGVLPPGLQINLNSVQIQLTSAVRLTLPGFALIADYSTSGDTSVSPTAAVAGTPNHTTVGTPVTIIWNTTNIVQVQIVANNGVDAPIDSGLIDTQGSGTYTIPHGLSVTTVFTLNSYDTIGHLALTPTTTITLPTPPPPTTGFGESFGNSFGS